MAKPNVLIFFTDDQRFDAVGCLGRDAVETPHLDQLIASGTAFTHAHIPGGTSGAVCMPSRAMLHTGRSLFRIHREGQTVPEEHTLMGEAFQAAGYSTFGIGKWHNSKQAYARSFSDGDEVMFGGMADHWNVPAHHYDPTGKYESRIPRVRDPHYERTIDWQDADHIHNGHHSTDLFAETACRFLGEQDGTSPFLLYVSLMAPHDPRTMPAEYLERYKAEDVQLPPNYRETHAVDFGITGIRDEVLAAYPRDEAEVRQHIADYYAMVTHLDDALGRVLAALDATGQRDNTIIVFAGDNGLGLGQHGHMGKQCLYDHSVRVPLVVAGPGVPVGQQRDELVCLYDIYGTLCALTGVETPESVEQKGFAGLLTDTSEAWRDELYLAFVGSCRAVTNKRMKLIEYAIGETQLFDLENDPWETQNLADQPEYADQLEAMRLRMWALSQETCDHDHRMGQEFWSERTDLVR